MGSDDRFNKRKPKRVNSRPPANPQCLIVCEGTKTEPIYFKELVNDLPAPYKYSVHVIPSKGSAPISVVNHAVEIFSNNKGDDSVKYEKIFCVIDRDTHETFDAAISKINSLKNTIPLKAIDSTPCFEVWFLLHFECSSSPFQAKGNKSVGDAVVSELKKKPGFKNYGKGMTGSYALLKEKMPDALTHAKRLREQDIDNPATNVDVLVRALQALSR